MTNKELIANIAAQTGMTKKQTDELLSATAQVIAEALRNDQSVVLQNFGSLEVKERQARQVVNPKTGEKTISNAKKVVGFRANVELKKQLK